MEKSSMKRSCFYILSIVLLLSLLAACTPGGSAPPATVAATSAPTATATSSGAAVSGQRTFVIVPEESKATYLADEVFFADALAKYGIAAGDSDVVGSTQAIAGQLQLNLDNLADALGENYFTVQMNTLATDRSLRDGWIRENGPRFNDYPEARFVATAIEGAPTSYTDGEEVSFRLRGDLTIREITQPATFDVTARLTGNTLTGVATTRLLMSSFGIDPPNFVNTLTVADEFGLEVQITAREQ
jgi:polyisoprenoid-binding protein YceI